ncbi:hypothetical protein [Sphingopyxis sp. 113P3]|uniref:hypothetical protein n=1 Tax=Sphingopyxis sp. (strain 113P3) TaxID=292913 RepID=UPI0006AD3DDC|nr:hypothetical protein [Sphingopyxis sp. 113P3]ALC11232.1 hypothetical protein LH20_04625 [Sphingopyxis sp. 113P3]
MAKYRKKPVVIEAVQYNGWEPVEGHLQPMFDHSFAPPDWLTEGMAKRESEAGAVFLDLAGDNPQLMVVTLEGHHIASVGDWIIRGVAGELYPCKPEIFAATYEPVA